MPSYYLHSDAHNVVEMRIPSYTHRTFLLSNLVFNVSTAYTFRSVPNALPQSAAFRTRIRKNDVSSSLTSLFSTPSESNDDDDDGAVDANRWGSMNDENYEEDDIDWMARLSKPSWETGNFDTTSSQDDSTSAETSIEKTPEELEEEQGEAWLDILQSIAADEVEFMNTEAERADQLRRMQEMGMSKAAIENTLNLATDDSSELEKSSDEGEEKKGDELLEKFREEVKETGFGMVVEDADFDLETVESHTRVEIDEETGESVRSQMVYVDEHACIGCTNCAMIAQSTFFMESEHGRARVFQQWGDDDETIQVAIETCPVDCIHYVPYDELKRLEVDRRGQNINFKARLVSQAEYGGVGMANKVGSAVAFTGPQKISGNMGARCNNCPSRGCKNCPMYGVGKNPEFLERERKRKEKMQRKKLKEEMESRNKSADL